MALRLLLPFLAIFPFVATADSDDTPPRTPYGILQGQYKTEQDMLKQQKGSLRPPELEERLFQLRGVYTHRFLALAKDHPSDDLWLDCLIWIGTEGVPGTDLDQMIDFMRSHAAKVENTLQLSLFMSELIPLESERLNPALGEIAAKHPDKSVRGAALYALAARTKMSAERDGSQEGSRAAEELLRRVVADFPDARTYCGLNKKNAERLLDELQSPVALGKTAPATKGRTLDGVPFDLANHRGKVVVLAFSGHWCGPCVKMHPIEKKLLDRYPRERLAVVEINSDEPGNLADVVRKIEKDGLHWQVVADGPNGPLSESWDVSSWPTYYLLDQALRIRRRESGYIGERLTEWVNQAIKDSHNE